MGKKAAQTWSNVNSDSPHGLRDKTHYMRKQVTRGASVSWADWCGKLHLYTVMSIFHTVCFSNWKVATRLFSRTPGDWAWVNLVGIRCNFLHGPRGIRPSCFLCQHWLGPVGNQEIQNKKDNPLLHVQPSKWGSFFFLACRGWEMTSGMRLDRMSDKGYLVFFPLDLIPVKTGYTRPLLKTAHVLLLYKNTQSVVFFYEEWIPWGAAVEWGGDAYSIGPQSFIERGGCCFLDFWLLFSFCDSVECSREQTVPMVS